MKKTFYKSIMLLALLTAILNTFMSRKGVIIGLQYTFVLYFIVVGIKLFTTIKQGFFDMIMYANIIASGINMIVYYNYKITFWIYFIFFILSLITIFIRYLDYPDWETNKNKLFD